MVFPLDTSGTTIFSYSELNLLFCAVSVVEKPTLASIWSAKGGTGRLFVLGEVVHIFRPLVYVLLIRKFGIRSWTPWLVSLAVELTSLGLLVLFTSLDVQFLGRLRFPELQGDYHVTAKPPLLI